MAESEAGAGSRARQWLAISALVAVGLALLLIWADGKTATDRTAAGSAPALEQDALPPAPVLEPVPAEPPPAPQSPHVPLTPGSPLDAHRDLLRLCLHQADAVFIDMQLYAYLEEAPGAEAVQQAVDRLAALDARLADAETPDGMAKATDLLRRGLADLRRDYTRPPGEPDRPAPAGGGGDELWEQAGVEISRFRVPTEGLPEDVPQPMPNFDSEDDIALYREALVAIEAADFASAYAILKLLEGHYPGNAFVLLRKCDCVAHVQLGDVVPIGETDDPDAEALEVLDRLVETDRYHPLLCEIWLKWRTLTQFYWHGASNYSDIPNWDYNERRWAFARLIGERLASRPADPWALAQKEALLAIPNIRRGGMMGNTNLTWWGVLFAADAVAEVMERLDEPGQPDEH